MSTKVINLTPDYLEHMDSIEKKIIFDKFSAGPKATKIIISDHDSGKILGEYHNKIVITGSIMSAMKAFGIDTPVILPNYNEELGLDNTLNYTEFLPKIHRLFVYSVLGIPDVEPLQKMYLK